MELPHKDYTDKILLIDWLDACFACDDIPEPLHLHSIGWFVQQDEKSIVIAMEEGNGRYRDYLCVPYNYIEDIHILEMRPPFDSNATHFRGTKSLGSRLIDYDVYPSSEVITSTTTPTPLNELTGKY